MSEADNHSADRLGGRTFVLDTNIVLDLWVFADPATEPLRAALAQLGTQVIATQVMRDELERVLAYPHLVRRQALDGQAAAAVLQAWDALITLHPVAPKARFTCTDGDDQKFIDLAAFHATEHAVLGNDGTGGARLPVVLLSKDKAVLRLKKRLATLGVTVVTRWQPPAAPSSL
jgi:predicted nucleic acid-binding protein